MLIVKDVLRRHVISTPPETTCREVAEIMRRESTGNILVMNGKEGFAGIITESDFVRKVVAADRLPYVVKASEIMSSPVISIDIDANIYEAEDLMDKNHILHLGVTEHGKTVGVVTIRDLIHPYEHFDPGSTWI